MTGRLFLLWLHRGALTLLCIAGAALAFCIIAAFILACRSASGFGHEQWLAALALARLFGWSSGAFLIAVAVWTVLQSLVAAFPAGGGGR